MIVDQGRALQPGAAGDVVVHVHHGAHVARIHAVDGDAQHGQAGLGVLGAVQVDAFDPGDAVVQGRPFVVGAEISETVAVAAGAVFLLTLALRSRMPIVPLAAARCGPAGSTRQPGR